jgi:hypothetical protein
VLLGIDHVVFALPDLDAATDALRTAVGLAAGGGGRHLALGTENRLAWLGDAYIELVAVADQALAGQSWLGAPALEALQRGGGLISWAVATDAIDEDVAALRAAGAAFEEPIPGERLRPDGSIVRWRVARAGPLGPSEPPFLIEHDPTSAEWTAADRAARDAQEHPLGRPVRLEVLELPATNMSLAIQRLSRTLGLRFRPSLMGGGARDANLGPHTVRLRPARGQAPSPAIELSSPAGDGRVVEMLGCRWSVRPSR